MPENYKTIYKGEKAEIIEKKSRFIAAADTVESEEEALEFIEKVRKINRNASHNCFAYTVGTHHEIVRSSDDGEPQGTAGHPILDVILGEDLCNTAVVVTRYFGGTLLGTGGLVRAYSTAARQAVEASVIIEKKLGTLLNLSTDYSMIGKIQYLLASRNILVMESSYTDQVSLTVLTHVSDLPTLKSELTEITGGTVRLQEQKNLYFAVLKEGEISTFPVPDNPHQEYQP